MNTSPITAELNRHYHREWIRTIILCMVTLALALALPKCEGKGSHPFVPAKVTSSIQPMTCPRGDICRVTITDIGNGLGDALSVRDYLHNPMAGVNIFWMYSTNPFCSLAIKTATTGYAQCVAALGGPPFDATGGHPVVSLWDGKRWQTITAQDIIRMHRRGI